MTTYADLRVQYVRLLCRQAEKNTKNPRHARDVSSCLQRQSAPVSAPPRPRPLRSRPPELPPCNCRRHPLAAVAVAAAAMPGHRLHCPPPGPPLLLPPGTHVYPPAQLKKTRAHSFWMTARRCAASPLRHAAAPSVPLLPRRGSCRTSPPKPPTSSRTAPR